MKKRFLPLSMLLITMVLAQASLVANAAGDQGKYTPRSGEKATVSSFMKSIRANQETGLIDPASLIEARNSAQVTGRDVNLDWVYAGPDNFGGMTKAVVYDNDGDVIIGTAGGDVYKTTNGGITFRKISGSSIEPISCMVMASNGDLYIGTGDGRRAASSNGLSNYGYSSSFVGKGIYVMRSGSAAFESLSATKEWAFVNEMTFVNGKLYAATENGLMVSTNNGESWTTAIAGEFRSVKSNNSGDVLAADTVNVFLSKNGASFTNVTEGSDFGTNNNMKIIAMSPNDANYMYIAFISGSAGAYETGDIYFTSDRGDSWGVAMAATAMYEIFGKDANIDGFMAVYPNNPKKLLIGSDNLWLFEDETGSGVNSYRPLQISEYYTYEYTPVAWNRYIYLHQGIQNIVFCPTNPNTFFVGTVGGIYKGEYYEGNYSYKSGNRYFLTDEDHTSVARMMSVGVGGMDMFLGGCLDHGTIMMSGTEALNNITTGYAVFPNPTATNNAFGYFDKEYAGGPCAISTINPYIFIVSGTGDLGMPLYRTETAGADYDLTKFSAQDVIKNENAFRTPYALFETYEDAHHSTEVKEILETYNMPLDTLEVIDTIFINDSVFVTDGIIYVEENDTLNMFVSINLNDTLYESDDDLLYIYNVLHDYLYIEDIDFDTLCLGVRVPAKKGDVLYYYSSQAGYPIDHTMPEPPHDAAHVDPDGGYRWIPGDTIRGLHDPLRTNLVVAIEGKVYMTRDALIFNKDTEWFLISEIEGGLPTAVTITSDGSTAYVGTAEGKLYKFTHIDDAFAAEQADVTNDLNPCVEMFDVTDAAFANRAITSIAVNPSNKNELLVTLGNYGHSNYVYRSTNAGSSFSSIQGDLGRFPVYSSIIEKETGIYVIGTEFGVYVSENGSSWSHSGSIECPVMEIKQAIMENHDEKIDVLYDEMGVPTYVIYPGIYNEGVIYAATYGAGIITCGTYKEGPEFGLDENDLNGNSAAQVNIYPNPANSNAQFSFNMSQNDKVSYQIYDLSGRMVTSRDLGYYTQGEHTVNFTVEGLTSGSYILRLQAGDKVNTAKFLVY